MLFGVIGFVAAVPFLLRLRRRYENWRVPGTALAVFALVFSLSTFVVGPAISGEDESTPKQTRPLPAGAPAPVPKGHDPHHE